MVPVEDGTFTLECPHPLLCYPKLMQCPNVKLRELRVYQWWNTGGRAPFLVPPFAGKQTVPTCLALPMSEIRLDKDNKNRLAIRTKFCHELQYQFPPKALQDRLAVPLNPVGAIGTGMVWDASGNGAPLFWWLGRLLAFGQLYLKCRSPDKYEEICLYHL